MALVALAGAACSTDADGKAAGQAQDACIVALEPVSQRRVPTAEESARAARLAETAADVDDRWRPLRALARDLNGAVLHGADPQPAIDALVAECTRVNDIVRTHQD